MTTVLYEGISCGIQRRKISSEIQAASADANRGALPSLGRIDLSLLISYQ
jgi:hypothetical protein